MTDKKKKLSPEELRQLVADHMREESQRQEEITVKRVEDAAMYIVSKLVNADYKITFDIKIEMRVPKYMISKIENRLTKRLQQYGIVDVHFNDADWKFWESIVTFRVYK